MTFLKFKEYYYFCQFIMSSALTGGKKPALCRYFTSTGSCSYGDDCQFLHSGYQQQPIQNTFLNGYVQDNEPLTIKDTEGVFILRLISSEGIVNLIGSTAECLESQIISLILVLFTSHLITPTGSVSDFYSQSINIIHSDIRL